MSVQPIISILEKLEKMHKSLLEHAYKKTELVKNNDMEELDKMLKVEQSHVAAIEQLEQLRQKKVVEFFQLKGIKVSSPPSVAELLEVIEDEEESQQLSDVRNRLLKVLDDLKKQNDLNQQLIYNSLQLVNVTLNMLRPQPEEINYSEKTVRGGNAPRQSLFDSQA
ncbi:flagellar protein FlgN [Ureibacillus thermosphaericus]|jgi:flagellar biosynthesis/type III secretory pathway chaperone|uniref:Flagellar biosynthesis/type III secretory pathway chaperone n=1 Tax=Ureibacillus thermosphaericus TaxID=51173 RepID=A0A840PZR4_URETH|nr:flagellar protein FlgN [Ureibacillus thermosphaericus]MBB5149718.1 flagellar biosynthesis/type III secretory pathway chaperone [Ureibacillus thermosphaericus]NKZ32648.1 flagellar protein FlgN [Ureibacillus thermosphaericus]